MLFDTLQYALCVVGGDWWQAAVGILQWASWVSFPLFSAHMIGQLFQEYAFVIVC